MTDDTGMTDDPIATVVNLALQASPDERRMLAGLVMMFRDGDSDGIAAVQGAIDARDMAEVRRLVGAV